MTFLFNLHISSEKCLLHTFQHLHMIHTISKNKKNCDLKFEIKPEVTIFLIFRECVYYVYNEGCVLNIFLSYAISSNKVAILGENLRNPICALLLHVSAKSVRLSCRMSDSNPM